jgi:ribonuclease P protein component
LSDSPAALAGTNNCGFGRELRLLAATQYAEVFNARRVLRGALFALHYRPAAQSGPQSGQLNARLGLVIPKKQARTAVLRNAIKRQAREIFRRQQADLPHWDLVLRLAQPVERTLAGDRQARAAWRAEIVALFEQLRTKTKTGVVTP